MDLSERQNPQGAVSPSYAPAALPDQGKEENKCLGEKKGGKEGSFSINPPTMVAAIANGRKRSSCQLFLTSPASLYHQGTIMDTAPGPFFPSLLAMLSSVILISNRATNLQPEGLLDKKFTLRT